MTEEPLDQLERQRAELYARLAGTGDFVPAASMRRGGAAASRTAPAQPDHRGHGPRYLWTRSSGGRTRTRQLASAELEGAPRDRELQAVRGGDRADRAGE